MRLTILGGGGFRVPLVVRALLRDSGDPIITAVVLHDTDPARLDAIEQVIRGYAADVPNAPTVRSTTSLEQALEGADFVFSAMRVGGLAGRVADERVALDLGVLGQETTGAGGIAYALRTVPVAQQVARQVATIAPDAWVINFTNPAGLITEAMAAASGSTRVVGICDSPLGLANRCARALGLPGLDGVEIDYAGLNHLGWLQGLRVDGVDRLPELFSMPERLAATEEGQLFGVDWLRTLGVMPNEYLYYWDYTRDAIKATLAGAQTRGEYLLDSQSDFYRRVAAEPEHAVPIWDEVRLARNASYMQDQRDAATARDAASPDQQRDEADVEGGGYEGVALALMRAIARDEPARLILNVRNDSGRVSGTSGTGGISGSRSLAIPGLPADAIVEVPCLVDAAGPVPLPVSPLTGARLGLVQQVKGIDRLVIEAATTGSVDRAVEAFALHPLVDSVTVARRLLAAYRERIPSLDAVFR